MNLHSFNQSLVKKGLSSVAPGDTVKVFQKIKEGAKFRTQAFEGVVIARKHGSEPGATITVRKMSGGIGVEKIFPIHLPTIEKIEIIKSSKVRRAKLYYLRGKSAKAARRKMIPLQAYPLAAIKKGGRLGAGQETQEVKTENSTPAAFSAENKVVESK